MPLSLDPLPHAAQMIVLGLLPVTTLCNSPSRLCTSASDLAEGNKPRRVPRCHLIRQFEANFRLVADCETS